MTKHGLYNPVNFRKYYYTIQTYRLAILGLILVSLFLNPILLFTQNNPHPAFKQYTTDDGLASPEVFYILQDKEGYIWIATDNGISRFNGYEFKNFGLKDGLTENVIYRMQFDSLERLWIQSMSGNLYYMEEDSIYPYWHNQILENIKDTHQFRGGFIVEGAGEKIHISTYKYGTITILEDGSVKEYPQKEATFSQVFEKDGKSIYSIFNYINPSLHAAHKNKLSPTNRVFPIYFHINDEVWAFPDQFNSTKEIQTPIAFYLADGHYLFQMSEDIWCIENGKFQWQTSFPYRIKYAHKMKNEQVLLGLNRHNGLRVFESINTLQKSEGVTWLPNKTINHFIEDREGGRWFATHEDGVFYAPIDAFMVYDGESGLADEKITALTIKNDKELFFGLENGEVYHLYSETNRWEKLPEIPAEGFVSDLNFDKSTQQLWASREKLYYFKNDKWVLCEGPNAEYPFIITSHFSKSAHSDKFWVYGFYGFLSVDLFNNTSENAYYGQGQRTQVVREDFLGKIWVGQQKGLFEWKDNRLIERQNLHPSFSLRVEDIDLMPDSTVVVATKGGGVVFWKDQQFENIRTEDGLTADMLECVHVDENGVVWAGTLNGLNRISGDWGNRKVEQITISHGLPSNEINRISTVGDHVWVATNKGLVHFSNKKRSNFRPEPFMESLRVNNVPFDVTKPITLKSNENNLSIRYSAINYKMNDKIPYRYRLNSQNWTNTESRTLNFPSLPHKEYLFEVQAQNEDGNWSESTTLQFVIHPPWWATWWARAIGVLALLSIVLMVYKYRMGQLKREIDLQRQLIDLKKSALQAQMNPHFIFNCLNSIQNYILQNEKEAAIMYLGSFASLVRSMLNASVLGKISLAEEVELLNNYLKLEKLRYKNRFDYKVSTAKNLNVLEVHIPTLLVQPYVENAVLHGISDKTEGGKVTVNFIKEDDCVKVLITDNGQGIRKDPENNISKKHKSFGMSITQERLEILFNQKGKKPVSFETLYDEHNQIRGTQVTIQIDIDKRKSKK